MKKQQKNIKKTIQKIEELKKFYSEMAKIKRLEIQKYGEKLNISKFLKELEEAKNQPKNVKKGVYSPNILKEIKQFERVAKSLKSGKSGKNQAKQSNKGKNNNWLTFD